MEATEFSVGSKIGLESNEKRGAVTVFGTYNESVDPSFGKGGKASLFNFRR